MICGCYRSSHGRIRILPLTTDHADFRGKPCSAIVPMSSDVLQVAFIL